MKSRATFYALLLIVTAGALALRLPRLRERPMHTDEAVQAVKAGALAESGEYRYNPIEFHGPTLYYFALPTIWLTAKGTIAECTEATFRIVPVLFGVGLVLLLFLIADGLGRAAALWAAVITAISPAMVFYSRFFIQEMLLVFFTFATIVAGWRYSQSRRLLWALLAGICLGLMHATKETCIVAYGSMFAALMLTRWWGWDSAHNHICMRHLLAGTIAAIAVSVLFFSSFFTNLRGPIDSVLTYTNYFTKGVSHSEHIYPWYYYLKMLLYTKYAPGPWWSEGAILALALIGLVAIFTTPRHVDGDTALLRFLAFYTIFMTAAYSLIPYKTPWCMLGFLHGLILLAGIGAASLVKAITNPPARWTTCLILIAANLHLLIQTHRANFQSYCCDSRNPYVYAHSVCDIVWLAQRVEELARFHPHGHAMLVKVIAPDHDYWPLPWYLRRFSRVGYWSEVPDNPDAPVIIASVKVQPLLDKKIHDTYQINCYGLRSQVHLLLYVKKELWHAFIKTREGPGKK